MRPNSISTTFRRRFWGVHQLLESQAEPHPYERGGESLGAVEQHREVVAEFVDRPVGAVGVHLGCTGTTAGETTVGGA